MEEKEGAMGRRWKAALGFGMGTLLGLGTALGVSTGLLEGMAMDAGTANLAGIALGGALAGAVGGASLGKGLLPVIGYGLAFIPLFYLYALSMMVFL
jgi:hypothetical protein